MSWRVDVCVWVLLAGVMGSLLGLASAEEVKKFPLLMPHVKPEKAETYFCTPIRIDPTQEYYITAFQPNASMDTAHHMLMYGCETPGSDKEVWNCGEMALAQPGIASAPVCGKGSQVIYAWAKDAPKLILPDGVAFRVGGKTDIQYIVLQVHYASVEKFKDGSTDDSGVFVYYTETPQPKSAGVLLMGTGGRINPKSVEYMETACTLEEDKIIHPFAFRTHTHALGRVVSGYKVNRNGAFDRWQLIGKKDPQLPQMFYPVASDMVLRKGDTVAARCTMQSNRERTTRVGATGKDEMCNFYLMYWVDGDNNAKLKRKSCFSAGSPNYYWRNDKRFKNSPEGDIEETRKTDHKTGQEKTVESNKTNNKARQDRPEDVKTNGKAGKRKIKAQTKNIPNEENKDAKAKNAKAGQSKRDTDNVKENEEEEMRAGREKRNKMSEYIG